MGFFDRPEVISPGSDPGRDSDRVAQLEQRVARLEAQVAELLARPRTAGPVAAEQGSGVDEQPWLADVLRLVAGGKKINAIKVYREQTGVGLKEAKDAVEALGG